MNVTISLLRYLKGTSGNKYIICVSEDQRIGLWNTLEKNFMINTTIAISATTICNKLIIITCSNDNEIQIWDF